MHAGLGIGAVGFGILTGLIGYKWGFGLVAMLLVVSVVPAWRDQATPPTRL